MRESHIALPECAIRNKEELCQTYLTMVYQDIIVPDQHKKASIAETHGELLPMSVSRLVSHLTLCEDDIFIDLGSGKGKVVTQVFLQSAVKEALGIEINPDWHQQALLAAERIAKDLPDFYWPDRRLTFLLGSMFQLSFAKGTVLWINSVCFTQSMLQQLGKIINDSSSIHTVCSLRPLPTLTRLPFKRTLRLECSWDSALGFIYTCKHKAG